MKPRSSRDGYFDFVGVFASSSMPAVQQTQSQLRLPGELDDLVGDACLPTLDLLAELGAIPIGRCRFDENSSNMAVAGPW